MYTKRIWHHLPYPFCRSHHYMISFKNSVGLYHHPTAAVWIRLQGCTVSADHAGNHPCGAQAEQYIVHGAEYI